MSEQNVTVNPGTKEILFVEPKLQERIWGGSRLKKEWNFPADRDDQLGELWAVSCNDQVDGRILNGSFKGRTLSDLWKNEPCLFGNPKDEVFPLLVKIIDAKENLSIQVHPEDTYAKEHENSKGKRECWYILDCPEDAKLIVGNRAGNHEELCRMIDEERWDDLLNYVPVKKGDFVQIDPGTLHAITGGIMLLEVQQNSDVTYRVYDYGRLQNGKPRELHLKQSKDVTKAPNLITKEHVVHPEDEPGVWQQLVETVNYKVWEMLLKESAGEVFVPSTGDSFYIAAISEGEGSVNGQALKRGQFFIIPNGCDNVKVEGNLRIVIAMPVM